MTPMPIRILTRIYPLVGTELSQELNLSQYPQLTPEQFEQEVQRIAQLPPIDWDAPQRYEWFHDLAELEIGLGGVTGYVGRTPDTPNPAALPGASPAAQTGESIPKPRMAADVSAAARDAKEVSCKG